MFQNHLHFDEQNRVKKSSNQISPNKLSYDENDSSFTLPSFQLSRTPVVKNKKKSLRAALFSSPVNDDGDQANNIIKIWLANLVLIAEFSFDDCELLSTEILCKVKKDSGRKSFSRPNYESRISD